MNCNCGNPSKGTELKMYYRDKRGDVRKYIYPERRCQKCINKARQKSELLTDKRNGKESKNYSNYF